MTLQFQKYLYSPLQKRYCNYFLGNGGCGGPKNFKKCMKLKAISRGVVKVLENIPSIGRHGYFLELHPA